MPTLELLQRHADLVVFVWVLGDQLGAPVPAVPFLVGIGALAGAGGARFATALGAAASASLLADLVWFSIGRWRGHRILSWLCKISLEPDSCVRRTETIWLAWGLRALIIAKFLPGLNTIAAALAGVTGTHAARFVGYAATAGVLWAVVWAGLGYLFSDAIVRLLTDAARLGVSGAGLLGAVLAAYVALKYVQRQRFLRMLRIARIRPEELKRKLDDGEPVVVLDLRTAVDVETMGYAIPGALRIAPEELERRKAELPRDREVVLYCT